MRHDPPGVLFAQGHRLTADRRRVGFPGDVRRGRRGQHPRDQAAVQPVEVAQVAEVGGKLRFVQQEERERMVGVVQAEVGAELRDVERREGLGYHRVKEAQGGEALVQRQRGVHRPKRSAGAPARFGLSRRPRYYCHEGDHPVSHVRLVMAGKVVRGLELALCTIFDRFDCSELRNNWSALLYLPNRLTEGIDLATV